MDPVGFEADVILMQYQNLVGSGYSASSTVSEVDTMDRYGSSSVELSIELH
jgi:hypothetical protein